MAGKGFLAFQVIAESFLVVAMLAVLGDSGSINLATLGLKIALTFTASIASLSTPDIIVVFLILLMFFMLVVYASYLELRTQRRRR